MPQLDQDYVFVPQRLLADLRANPAAIGTYALIARLFLIYQEPIPLSAADLQRYDPTLSYGAARGALQRLTALGWLQERSGHKNHYTPTWSVIKGAALPWRMDAPTLGRPAHVVTLRLDRRLLDIGMGRLIPHSTYPAETHNRYLVRPIFSLRDVGAYAQVLGGQSLAATPALWRYGLIRDSRAHPLTSAADLVARASQRTLDGDGAALTASGMRLLGMDYPSEQAAPARKQTLFFVDHALIPDLIPQLIPDLIPSKTEFERPFSASGCNKKASTNLARVMPGTQGNPSDSSDSPPNPPARLTGGGGGDLLLTKKSDQETSELNIKESQPETESARLLRSIGAFPSSVEELAEFSAELVKRAIAYAEFEPGIVNVPGWVVEALRRHRDEGWSIPSLRTRRSALSGEDGPIDASAYVGGAYGDLFRLGSDLTDLEDHVRDAPAQTKEQAVGAAVSHSTSGECVRPGSDRSDLGASPTHLEERAVGAPARPTARDAYAEHVHQAHNLGGPKAPPPAHIPAVLPHATAGTVEHPSQVVPNLGARRSDARDTIADIHRSAEKPQSMAIDAALTQKLRAELLMQCGRRYRRLLAGLEIQTTGGTTLLICANVSEMAVVQNELLGAIHGILARLDAPPQLTCTTRAAWQARAHCDGIATRGVL